MTSMDMLSESDKELSAVSVLAAIMKTDSGAEAAQAVLDSVLLKNGRAFACTKETSRSSGSAVRDRDI